MVFRKTISLYLLTLFLAGCNPTSLEDYQREGEAISKQMIEDLEKVQTREDLVKIIPTLKKRFNQIVDLAIEAKEFKESDSEDEDAVLESSKETSDRLRAQLHRIYQLEGARELMEQAQREALFKLDAFERSLAKKKQTKIIN